MGSASQAVNIASVALAPFTMGTSLLAIPAKSAYQQTLASRNQRAAQATDVQRQQEESQRRQMQLLQQPKQVAPQDFLAMREKQLRTMKIGLASTISGAGGAPAPTLSAPSLTPTGQGKSKMGA